MPKNKAQMLIGMLKQMKGKKKAGNGKGEDTPKGVQAPPMPRMRKG